MLVDGPAHAGGGEPIDDGGDRAVVELDPDRDTGCKLAPTDWFGPIAQGLLHDLNNLLTAIQAAATVFPDDREGPSERFAAIHGAVHRAADLVALLAGPAPAATRSCASVALTLAWAARLLRFLGARSGIEVGFDSADVCVAVDRHTLDRVVVNLGVNAVDAMAAGGGRLDLRATTDGPGVRLEVVDTGPGIGPDQLASLFRPGRSTKPGHDGVGLATVHALVTAAGGSVAAESTPGVGTRVVVYLPRAGG